MTHFALCRKVYKRDAMRCNCEAKRSSLKPSSRYLHRLKNVIFAGARDEVIYALWLVETWTNPRPHKKSCELRTLWRKR